MPPVGRPQGGPRQIAALGRTDRGLPQRGPLTVITNSLPAIVQLSGAPGIEIISTGGTYRHGYDAFFGMIASDAAPLEATAPTVQTPEVLL